MLNYDIIFTSFIHNDCDRSDTTSRECFFQKWLNNVDRNKDYQSMIKIITITTMQTISMYRCTKVNATINSCELGIYIEARFFPYHFYHRTIFTNRSLSSTSPL